MLRPILWATIAVATVVASGDFVVLHSPDTVKFEGNAEIPQSLVKEIFSAVLGMTVKQRAAWPGMSIADPFSLPDAAVAVAVEGVNDLERPTDHRFPLNVDEVEETTWQALSGRLEERVKNNTLVRIGVGDGVDALGQSTLGELRPTPIDENVLQSLNVEKTEDRKILDEIQLLYAIANKVKSDVSAYGKSGVYWLVVSGMRALIERDGKDSPAVREALAHLNDALSAVTTAFKEVYKNNVVIVAFTNDASKVRDARSINLERERREEPKTIKIEDLNHAKKYNDNYPAIFNIMLWFGVAFVFSLMAVCIAIADMDPGRDSIIYRMTSTRMKKDN